MHVNRPGARYPRFSSTTSLNADQEERRARILHAAQDLVLRGYGAVLMRTVAENSDVATATVYDYFPSKDHLLVTCLQHWLMDFRDTAAPLVADIDDPYDRLFALIQRLNAEFFARPGFADAVARAYLFADVTVGAAVAETRTELTEMLADTMATGVRTRRHLEIGGLLADVWATHILAVVHERATARELQDRLAVAVAVIRNHLATGSIDELQLELH